MGRALLAAAIVAAIAFSVFPEIDLWVSGLFYDSDGGFHLNGAWWTVFLYEAIPVVAMLVGGGALLLLIRNLAVRGRASRVVSREDIFPEVTARSGALRSGRAVRSTRFLLFVLLALAVGPGLVVNAGLKDNWGRARPRDVTQFGGGRQFTPALVPSDQCERNCSFVAGHPSVMFWLAALAWAASGRRRRQVLAVAVTLGLVAGLGRIAQGGHFLSDVMFSGIVTLTVVWALATRVFKLDAPRGTTRRSGAR